MRVLGRKVSLPWVGQSGSARRGSIRLAGRGLLIWGTMGVVIVHYILWAIFPFTYAFVRSFTKWQPLVFDFNFIGLSNYREALFKDTLFWPAMGKTAYFTLANVGIGTILALGPGVMQARGKTLSGAAGADRQRWLHSV